MTFKLFIVSHGHIVSTTPITILFSNSYNSVCSGSFIIHKNILVSFINLYQYLCSVVINIRRYLPGLSRHCNNFLVFPIFGSPSTKPKFSHLSCSVLPCHLDELNRIFCMTFKVNLYTSTLILNKLVFCLFIFHHYRWMDLFIEIRANNSQ